MLWISRTRSCDGIVFFEHAERDSADNALVPGLSFRYEARASNLGMRLEFKKVAGLGVDSGDVELKATV